MRSLEKGYEERINARIEKQIAVAIEKCLRYKEP
jgi:hypothetical protein